MPLLTANDSIEPISLTKVPDEFIIFYSSIVDGKLWCPDCRDVEELVKDTFSSPDSHSAIIVYVGDRSQWKLPSNVYRAQPWEIRSIPTIVRLKEGKEIGRIDDISQESLKSFIDAAGQD